MICNARGYLWVRLRLFAVRFRQWDIQEGMGGTRVGWCIWYTCAGRITSVGDWCMGRVSGTHARVGLQIAVQLVRVNQQILIV